MLSCKQQHPYLSSQFMCIRKKNGSGDYYWEIFTPLKEPLNLPESFIEKPRGVDHYEICHTLGCHYDIITQGDGLRPTEPPHIAKQHSYLEI